MFVSVCYFNNKMFEHIKKIVLSFSFIFLSSFDVDIILSLICNKIIFRHNFLHITLLFGS